MFPPAPPVASVPQIMFPVALVSSASVQPVTPVSSNVGVLTDELALTWPTRNPLYMVDVGDAKFKTDWMDKAVLGVVVGP